MTQPFDFEPVDPGHVQPWPAPVPLTAPEAELQPPAPRRRFSLVAFFLPLLAGGGVPRPQLRAPPRQPGNPPPPQNEGKNHQNETAPRGGGRQNGPPGGNRPGGGAR